MAKAKTAKRICVCKKVLAGLHTLCGTCRQKDCPHTDFHYDATLSKICVCGIVLNKNGKHQAKHSQEIADKARELIGQGKSNIEIAAELMLTDVFVSAVRNGRIYKMKSKFKLCNEINNRKQEVPLC
jgi:hypothetical protein